MSQHHDTLRPERVDVTQRCCTKVKSNDETNKAWTTSRMVYKGIVVHGEGASDNIQCIGQRRRIVSINNKAGYADRLFILRRPPWHCDLEGVYVPGTGNDLAIADHLEIGHQINYVDDLEMAGFAFTCHHAFCIFVCSYVYLYVSISSQTFTPTCWRSRYHDA